MSLGPKTCLIILAPGAEEIEFATTVDVLRRAAIVVTVAAVGADKVIAGSRAMKFVADCLLEDVKHRDFDCVVVPGGMPGAQNCGKDETVAAIIKRQNNAQRYIASICAAPAVVLAPLGILDTKRATCFPAPGFIEKLPNHSQERVVVDGHIVTSQAPGTAMEFAVTLVKLLISPEESTRISKDLKMLMAA